MISLTLLLNIEFKPSITSVKKELSSSLIALSHVRDNLLQPTKDSQQPTYLLNT